MFDSAANICKQQTQVIQNGILTIFYSRNWCINTNVYIKLLSRCRYISTITICIYTHSSATNHTWPHPGFLYSFIFKALFIMHYHSLKTKSRDLTLICIIKTSVYILPYILVHIGSIFPSKNTVIYTLY